MTKGKENGAPLPKPTVRGFYDLDVYKAFS